MYGFTVIVANLNPVDAEGLGIPETDVAQRWQPLSLPKYQQTGRYP